jgi:hypothetical protein
MAQKIAEAEHPEDVERYGYIREAKINYSDDYYSGVESTASLIKQKFANEGWELTDAWI